MTQNELADIRNRMIGFIFQQYNLLPKLNLLENVELPLLYAHVPGDKREERALQQLERVGLGDKARKYAEPALGRSAATRLDCESARRKSVSFARRRADRCA